MDAQFNSSVLQLERQYADEQSRIQADFEGKQRTLPSGTATSPLMLQYLEDKRTAELRKLQQLYYTRKQDLEATHEQERRVHLESFMHRMDATMPQVVPDSRVSDVFQPLLQGSRDVVVLTAIDTECTTYPRPSKQQFNWTECKHAAYEPAAS
jgi:L-lactate utilization protein LutC